MGSQVEVLNMAGEHQFWLPRARDIKVQEDYNGAGAVAFEIDTRTPGAAEMLALREGLIRVSVEGVPVPVCGLLDENSFDLPEGPDRPITVSCPGTLTLLAEALLWPANTAKTTDGDKGWRQWHQVTPGRILTDVITEAKARGGITNVVPTFTAEADSRGRAWSDLISRKFKSGNSVLDVVDQLAGQGVIIVAMHGLSLSVYDYVKEKASDEADPLVLLPNWFTQAPVQVRRAGLANTVLVEGEAGEHTSVSVSDGTRRRELHLTVGGMDDPDELGRMAAEALSRARNDKENYSVAYVAAEGRPEPWSDYSAGAVVVRNPPFDRGGTEPIVVRSINVSIPATGGVHEVSLEVGDRAVTPYRAEENDGTSRYPDTPFPGVLDPQPFVGWNGIDTHAVPEIPDFPPVAYTTEHGTFDMSVNPKVWDAVPKGGKLELWTGPSADFDSMILASTGDRPGMKLDMLPYAEYPGFVPPVGPEPTGPVWQMIHSPFFRKSASNALFSKSANWTTFFDVYGFSETTEVKADGRRNGFTARNWVTNTNGSTQTPPLIYANAANPSFHCSFGDWQLSVMPMTLYVRLKVVVTANRSGVTLPTTATVGIQPGYSGNPVTVQVPLDGTETALNLPTERVGYGSARVTFNMPDAGTGDIVTFELREFSLTTGRAPAFDGDTPSTGGVSYTWLDTVRASPSKRE